MKVFIQWATDPISRSEQIDSSEWDSLPKKRDPTGTNPIIDNLKGWIQSMSVMGITITADHYSINENPPGYPIGSITVTFWNDSGIDEDKKHAAKWYFQPLKLREIDGVQKWVPNSWEERFYSPRLQQKLIDDKIIPIFANGRKVKINNYSDFIPTDETKTRHGVMLSDSLNAEYQLEKIHFYREWV